MSLIEECSEVLCARYTFNVQRLLVVFSTLDVQKRNVEGVHYSYFVGSDKRAIFFFFGKVMAVPTLFVLR